MLKHSENLSNKEKVKYDLYKILRMSILLNQKEVDKLTLDKFKEASLSIDKMLGEDYDEKIEDFFYETTTLEEEGKRLKELVAFINDRIEKRKDLLEDYRSVTNKELNDLEYINRSGEIDLYEARLKLIKSYLDNSKLIEVNEKELEILKEDLVKEYDIKSANEIKNTKIEDTLHNTFVNTLYEMDMYSSIEAEDIDSELEKIKREIKETKEQKDTFESAFDNLKISGISGELELEYASYVENARRNYYYVKEKEIILKLYKLIEEKESEYGELFTKREEVKSLLQERISLRKNLEIKDKDILAKVNELVIEQSQEIEIEKENIDNISILTERIRLKENRLEDLNREIKRPEVLSLLKEYEMIDTYNVDDDIDTNEDIDDIIPEEESELEFEENDDKSALDLLNELLPDEEKLNLDEPEENKEIMTLEEPIVEETIEEPQQETEEEPKEKEFKQNQIKNSEMLLSMNFGLSRLKAISVMKRVGDMLGVNAKKAPEVVTEVPKDEIFVAQPNIEEIQKDETVQEKNDDLFWTTNEFIEMKEETEGTAINSEDNIFVSDNNVNTNENIFIEENNINNKEDIFTNNNIKDESIFEFKMPEINNEISDNQIFETSQPDNGLIFPEPVMPNGGQDILPENKEDKFMWPENGQTIDINGIFPS